jgi:hypothetical protein
VVDYFHRAFHLPRHWLHSYQWFQKLMKRHDIHHWTRGNYGIVFFWMDWLGRTLRDDFPFEKENLFP